MSRAMKWGSNETGATLRLGDEEASRLLGRTDGSHAFERCCCRTWDARSHALSELPDWNRLM